MARPKKCRRITAVPEVRFFKPQGIPLRELSEVYLSLEGAEALRLIDLEGLNQQQASERMNISRHTFGRLLSQARKVVTGALIYVFALRIDGGDFIVAGREPYPRCRRKHLSVQTEQNKEANVTKIAITSEGPTLDDQVDPRFGRAGGFVLVDLETMQTEYIDNGSCQTMANGAGIQAAENIARAGAQVLLTGFVGPKAFQALSAAGVQIGQDLEGITVREAIERYKDNTVAMASQPNSAAGGQGRGRGR
ncbi:MAG: DUF134 domain-containing protein [Desulfovibrionales bacterium]